MKKTSILALTSVMALLGGCATPMPPAPMMVDREPILVGKPVGERLSEARNKISNQITLLNQLQEGGVIGEYKIVQHNNNLDARVGSSRTIPKSYANPQPVKPVADATTKNPVGENKIKKIEWNNNSLNTLTGNFAKALGYELVTKQGSFNDVNINFTVENVSVQDALKKLQTQISPFADLMIVDENKTVNLIYKK